MDNTTARHQYGFSFMRCDTGGQRVHSFWGSGASEEECKADAHAQARAYASKYENELNEKARAKSRQRGDHYAPSHINVRIVGCSLWR